MPFQPAGAIGTAPDGTPIDNAVLAQGDGAGVDLAGATKPDLTPKLLTTADGKPVLNDMGEPIHYPAAYPPEFFKNAGEQAAQFNSFLPSDLYKFRQGGEWDMQRLSGKFDENYIDYATVAIGIYSDAAGINADAILTIQNIYAGEYSKYKDGTTFDSHYKNLPASNVYNTYIGYGFFNP